MKQLLISLVLMFITGSAGAQDNHQIALMARKAYDAGQYAECIQQYEKILQNGYESPVLYHNLGNAYYRNNEIPSAILYYEKALKLDPTNSETRYNLAFVNNKITDKVEFVPELFYKRWWKALLNNVSLEFLAVSVIICLAMALLSISVYLVSRTLFLRKFSFWTGILFILLLLFSFFASQRKEFYLRHHLEAIVFTPTVTVKSSPDQVSKDLFVIHEGLKVELLDQIGEWQEIRIANGSVGWLKTTDIRAI